MTANPIVEVDQVSKSYKGAPRPAVDKLSLNIDESTVFGLLGPNGAGKTTLISMLCCLFGPDEGQIKIGGFDLREKSSEAKRIIGVVPQEIALYPKLTAYENLMFMGQMYGLPTQEIKQRIKKNLEVLGLIDKKDEQIRFFSGGMKRRINLIAGLLHHPRLLILDEPTVGVDIQSKTAIIDHLKMLNRDQGMTIFYASHHLDEAEDFCSHIAIIDEGKVVTSGKTTELIAANNCKTIEEVYLNITGKRFRD